MGQETASYREDAEQLRLRFTEFRKAHAVRSRLPGRYGKEESGASFPRDELKSGRLSRGHGRSYRLSAFLPMSSGEGFSRGREPMVRRATT